MRIRRQSLEALRATTGRSRAKVAADLDMSERHLYRLERGITPLRRFQALRFAAYYGVDVKVIVESDENGSRAA